MTNVRAVAELKANPGRKLAREVDGQLFYRYPIRTHFVELGENYFELIDQYIVPYYREGDILSISEKIITLCQENILYKEQLKVGLMAKVLSSFVMKTPYGQGPGNVLKMQAIIKLCGRWRVLIAAILSVIGKLFGVRGIFYRYLANNTSSIDGFNTLTWDYYGNKGLLGPVEPNKVCQEIREKYGMDCMIVDANNIGVEIMGANVDIPYDQKFLADLIRDNPAGQGTEQTPFILIRKEQSGK